MIATYRLQLTPEQPFAAVTRMVPYLARLGVSHLYLSPITDARRGSQHGYDVVDHGRIREELGGEAGFEALRGAAVAAGLEIILDFVPNHAGVGPRNVRWQDLLAYGPASAFARFFDVDWRPLKRELAGRILLPVLGKPYGDALDAGEIGVVVHDGRLAAAYFQQRFTLAPHTCAPLLEHAAARLDAAAREHAVEIARACSALGRADRQGGEALRGRLVRLSAETDLDEALKGIAPSLLHSVLERQHFRLAYWKTAGSEINYRRFFSINELVALRVEDPVVFEEIHTLLFELLRRPGVGGVRVDHVDGLFDPRGYLARLREHGASRVWVEKILALEESLPDWPVEGTTGYEFASDVMRVLTWPDSERAMERMLRLHVPGARPFQEEVHRGKRLVMRSDLGGELERLAAGLDRFSEADYHTRDFTRDALREALAEVVAAFPRYRTYLPDDLETESAVVRAAIDTARSRNRGIDESVFGFIARVLLGRLGEALEPERRAWVARFQQYTAPVAAKGVEDTAFYRQLRLAAHSEVGNDPDRWAMSPAEFHTRAAVRAERWPRNLLATSTHDTKRGEDLRARLLVLAELPAEWRRVAWRLRALSQKHRTADGPSDGDVYLFFQTLVAIREGSDPGSLPDRLAAYAQKAAREAKQRTSWTAPDERYERALDAFVRGMLADPALDAAIGPFAGEVARYGFTHSLSQLVLKVASPGVPDFYRGAEWLELALVDPDNRRPLDTEGLRRSLEEISPLVADGGTARILEVLERRDGLSKLLATARLLHARRSQRAAFEGRYRPLRAVGERADAVLAFARESDDGVVIAVVPRFPARLVRAGGFGDTHVPVPWAGRRALDLLTGSALPDGPISPLPERPLLVLLR